MLKVDAYTPTQQSLHNHAKTLSQDYLRLEWELVEVLSRIELEKLYKKLGIPSLFQYAVSALGLSEAVAYSFISVARKSILSNELRIALRERTLSVSKASRIVSTLNESNVSALIEFAKTNSTSKIDQEVARLNPRSAQRNKVKYVSEESVQLQITVNKSTYEKILRAQAVLSTKTGTAAGLDYVLEAAAEVCLEKYDPVRKAERAQKRQRKLQQEGIQALQQTKAQNCGTVKSEISTAPELLCLNRVPRDGEDFYISNQKNAGQIDVRKPKSSESTQSIVPKSASPKPLKSSRRKPLTAAAKHAVHLREGGGNEPANISTLCAYHHDLVHQLSFPLDGQFNYLRSPVVRYVC